jgi:quercetin dioxygenase-like cupin family protein
MARQIGRVARYGCVVTATRSSWETAAHGPLTVVHGASLPARQLLGAHRHPPSGFVFAYVVSGAIRSQVEGGPLRVYRAVQSWTEPPNAHHLVSANASKTKPARLIAYIIADDGAQPTVFDK